MANGGRIGGRNVPGIDGYSGIWTPNEIADATRKGVWPQDFPKTISGLTLWFAADHLTGFNDGDAVTTWPDQSGNGYDVTQATGANKPLYKTNIFKDKPALLFDGSDDYFENTTQNPFTAGAARTVFVAGRVAVTNGSTFITFRRTARCWAFLHYLDSGNPGAYITDGVSVTNNSPSVSGLLNTFGVYCARGTAGALSKFRMNGGNGVVSGGALVAEAGSTGFYVGRRELGTMFMNGHIAEIVAYDSELSDADCSRVERYLNVKYSPLV